MSTVYSIVTERIVKALESGTVPWRRPWGGEERSPRNACTRRPYRGVNVFLLSAGAYDSPYWLTYRQAEMWGGHVCKGEHGCPVVFWSKKDVRDKESGEQTEVLVLRYYTVFNLAQCDGLPTALSAVPGKSLDFQPVAQCEEVLAGMPENRPTISHVAGSRATA